MATQAEILTGARAWLGVPFRWCGRTRRGIDCGSLIFAVGHAAGCPGYDRMPVYRPSMLPAVIRTWMACYFEPLPSPRAAAPGDVLVMTDGRHPIHLGIVSGTDPFTVIHASVFRKQVVEGPPHDLTPIAASRYFGLEN